MLAILKMVLFDKAVTKINSFPRTGAMKEGAGSKRLQSVLFVAGKKTV
jgi:hypothetical protein